MLEDQRIIFFDGECNLCNGFVDLLLRIDRQGLFKLSPLQGKTAHEMLPPLPIIPEEWSVFYWDDHQIYSQSTAVIKVCERLGGLWQILAAIAQLLPVNFRDWVYRVIANNRYRWFGKLNNCRLPNDHEKSRFLS